MFLQSEFANDEIEAIQKLIKAILADGKITPDEIEDFENMKKLSKQAAGKLMAIAAYKPIEVITKSSSLNRN